MNFLNPFFLFGLLAVALPVVIHLINLRRPQKISFSTLSFFKELRESTIRRIRFKQYLLMALRALALLCLALALARPFLPPTLTGSTSSGAPQSVAILIDNSASMNRIGSKGPLIDQARQIAYRIIQNGNSDDKFLIAITNQNEGQSEDFTDAFRAREKIKDIEVRNSAHYTKEAFMGIVENIRSTAENQAVIYLISDGQASQLQDLSEARFDEQRSDNQPPIPLQLIKLEQANQQNVAITSLSLQSQMLSSGAPVTLSAEVENVGNSAVANQFVSLEVEGTLSGQYELSLQPGESRQVSFEVVPESVGDITGRIILEGDEVEYDNQQYFVIRIPKKRSILLVNNDEQQSSFTSYLAPALQAAEQTNAQLSFIEKRSSAVDQSQWNKFDAIVLDGLDEIPEYWFRDLQQFVQKGRGVLFLPSEQGNVTNYNNFFAQFNAGRFQDIVGEYGSFQPVVRLAPITEGHPVIDELFEKGKDEQINVELPSLFYYFNYKEPSNSGSFSILQAANGDHVLDEQQFGEGVVLISAIGADPGWSNFPVNPLFAPLYYRSILYTSSSENGGLKKHVLGSPFEWEGPLSTDVTLNLNGRSFKPEIERRPDGVQINYEGREWTPGILTVKDSSRTFKIGVNQDIMESRVGTLEESKWQQMFSSKFEVSDIINAGELSDTNFSETLNTAVFGKEIWNWFVWLALLFLIMETMVSRLYKAESIS